VPSKAMRYDFFMLRSQNADQTNVTPNFRIIFPSSVERAGMAGRYTGSYLDRSNGWRAIAILAETDQASLVGRIPDGPYMASAQSLTAAHSDVLSRSHPDSPGCGRGEIEFYARRKWTAIIHSHSDFFACARIKLVKNILVRLLTRNVLMRAHQLLVLLPKAVCQIERNIDR
jgi:hypothetical protein